MKRSILAICVLVAGCGGGKEAARTEPSSNLPKPGLYELTRRSEVIGSAQPAREDVSERCLSPSKMEEEFHAMFAGKPQQMHGCHDMEADIGDGRFALKMLCDAPDGDINNIPSEIHGTYSSEEFEIVEQITVFGTVQVETKRYRRIGDC